MQPAPRERTMIGIRKSFFIGKRLRLFFIFPAWRKLNAKSKKFGYPLIHSPIHHTPITQTLKFFYIIAFVTKFSILETKATILLRFSFTWVSTKRHETALAGIGLHKVCVNYKNVSTFSRLSRDTAGKSGEGGIWTRGTLRYTALAKLHDRPLWHLSLFLSYILAIIFNLEPVDEVVIDGKFPRRPCSSIWGASGWNHVGSLKNLSSKILFLSARYSSLFDSSFHSVFLIDNPTIPLPLKGGLLNRKIYFEKNNP